MRGDSDDDAGAACSAAEWRQNDRSSAALLQCVSADLRCAQRELSTLPDCVPRVVTFCVDDTPFALRRELLLRDPQSVLFVLAAQHYARGATGPILISGRDPKLFAALLNVLRGYRRAVPDALRAACAAEAQFFGLTHSWRAQSAAFSNFSDVSDFSDLSDAPDFPAPPVVFRPLGGGGDRLRADFVCAAAGPHCAVGQKTVIFRVERCDAVAFGAAEEGAPRGVIDGAGGGSGLALFWCDGRVAHNFDRPVTEKTGCTFAAKTNVRVELDCEDALVRWVLPGEQCVAVVRLPARRKYAIVAVAARFSEVRILHSE